MSSDAESGKGGGGLFASIGRLFGRSSAPETSARSDRAESPRERPKADSAEAGSTRSSFQGVGPAADEDDDEDELVLGPSLKTPSADENEGREDEASGDEAREDELMLTAGPASEEAAEAETPTAEPGPEETEPEADAILAKLRAVREEQDGEEAGADERLTTSEDEWAASFGAPVSEPSEEGETSAGSSTWPRESEGDEREPAEASREPVQEGLSEAEQMTSIDKTGEDRDGPKPESESSQEAVQPFPPQMNPSVDEVEGQATKEAAGAETEERAAGEPEGNEPVPKDPEADEPVPEKIEAELSTAEAPAVAEPETEITDAGTESETERPAEAPEQDGAEAEDRAEGETLTDEPAAEQTPAGDGADEENRIPESPAAPWENEAFADEQPEGDEPEAASSEPEEPGAAWPEASDGEEPEGRGIAASLAAAGVVDEGATDETATDEAAPQEPASAGAGLDEAAVEEIVRRLIREEMEGELGERLSANIRRMIRDEVARAMIRHR